MRPIHQGTTTLSQINEAKDVVPNMHPKVIERAYEQVVRPRQLTGAGYRHKAIIGKASRRVSGLTSRSQQTTRELQARRILPVGASGDVVGDG